MMTDIHTDDQTNTGPQAALLPGAGGAGVEDAGRIAVETGGAGGGGAEDAGEVTVGTGRGLDAQLVVMRENTEKFQLAKDLMAFAFPRLGIPLQNIKYGPDFASLMDFETLSDIDISRQITHHELFKGMFFALTYDTLPDQIPNGKNLLKMLKDAPNSFKQKNQTASMFFVYKVTVQISAFNNCVTLSCFPIVALQHIRKYFQDGGFCLKQRRSPSSFMDMIMEEVEKNKEFYQQHLHPISFILTYSSVSQSIIVNVFGKLYEKHITSIECMGYIAQELISEPATKPTKKPRPEASSTRQLNADAKSVEAAYKKMHSLRHVVMTGSQEVECYLKSSAFNLEMMKGYTFQGVEFPPDTLRVIIDRIRMSTSLGAKHDTTSEKLRTMRNLVNHLCELRLEDLESGTFRDLTQQIEDFLRAAALKSMQKTDPSKVGDYADAMCAAYPFWPPMEEAIARYVDAEELIQKYGGYLPTRIIVSDLPADLTEEAFVAMALDLVNCTKPQACKDAPSEDQRAEANYHIADYYKQHWNPDYIKNSMEGAKFYLMLHCHPQLCSFGREMWVFRLLVHMRFFDKYKSSQDLLALLREFAAQFLAEKDTGIDCFDGVWVPSNNLSSMLDDALKRADQAAAAEEAQAAAAVKAAKATKKKGTGKKGK